MAKEKRLHACFTGHRYISASQLPGIKTALEETVASLVSQGFTTYYNGGAAGYDMLAAEIAIALKNQSDLPIKLIMALPCKEHDAKWNDSDKARLQSVLNSADEVLYLSEQYYDGCMAVRNKYLVEHSGVCVAYMTRRRSGAGQTVRLAREHGLTVINLGENLIEGVGKNGTV